MLSFYHVDNRRRDVEAVDLIIDFHTHVQPDTDLEAFLAEMDAQGIDMAVVQSLGADQPILDKANAHITKIVERYPQRLIGFASVMPTHKNAVADLVALIGSGFKGLKLHPPIQHFSVDDPRLAPLMDKCAELQIPVLFHTGGVFLRTGVIRFADSLHFDELAIRHPDTTIIMAHGQPFSHDPYIVGKHPNVYMDTSVRFANIARLIPNIGPELLNWIRSDEKVIFGSDASPTKLWRFKYNLDPLKEMAFTEESRAKILGGTARKLLGL